MRGGGLFAPISREGALVMNNLLLATMTATVLLGTLYPLLLELTTGGTISVGAPFYAATFVPLALPLLLLMAVGPFMGWKRGDVRGALQRLIAAGVLPSAPPSSRSGSRATGRCWRRSACSSAYGCWSARDRVHGAHPSVRRQRRRAFNRARHMPRAAYGMSLAHFGLAVAIIGMTGAAAWKTEEIKVLQPGQSLTLQGYDFKLESVGGIRGENYLADQAHFVVSQDGEFVANLYPERRQYLVQPMPTTEAAIRSTPLADLYAVIGEPDGKGGWIVRVYHEPLVPWIWFGALIMVAGGLTSLSDRRYRVGAPVRAGAAQAAKA